ncbi:hypothetical protein LINGRAHAP2_LOCUS4704, partial [Linum grandiflorum]
LLYLHSLGDGGDDGDHRASPISLSPVSTLPYPLFIFFRLLLLLDPATVTVTINRRRSLALSRSRSLTAAVVAGGPKRPPSLLVSRFRSSGDGGDGDHAAPRRFSLPVGFFYGWTRGDPSKLVSCEVKTAVESGLEIKMKP